MAKISGNELLRQIEAKRLADLEPKPLKYPVNLVLIAIDPGASGGLAVQRGDLVTVHKMPETPRDVCDIIEAGIDNPKSVANPNLDPITGSVSPLNVKCYMEQVGGFAGEGQPGSAMFNFGRGFGNLEGILVALKIPFELVPPRRWIEGLKLGSKGHEVGRYTGMTPEDAKKEKSRVSKINNRLKTAWKNRLKERAQRFFPTLKVTLATSDCLLILEYARKELNLARGGNPDGQGRKWFGIGIPQPELELTAPIKEDGYKDRLDMNSPQQPNYEIY